MRFSRLFFFIACTFSALSLGAQDVHYTLHNYAPLWLNPANTGAFSGSIRVGGVYRGQWHSLNGINSPTAYADAPLAFGLRKQDWIGVGVSLVAYNAGRFDLSSTFFGFSGAYHLSLDKKRENVLTLGVQYGSTSYGLTMPMGDVAQQEVFEGRPAEMIGMPDLGGPGNNNNNNNNYNSLNAGIKLKVLMDKKKNDIFEAGVSVLHLNNPDRRSLVEVEQDTSMMNPPNPTTNSRENRRRRPTIHAHARADLEMSEKWRFQPTAFFQSSAGTSSVSLQAWGSRNLKKDLDLRLGLGYRTADAAKVLVGLDTDRLRAALAYDITLSQARNVNSYQGAFELGLAYVFNIYKKPEVTPTILCPRL
ncbi:MAG: PorP/SprF family type IX secretion system membrane protein [Bacteroidota bacterium]